MPSKKEQRERRETLRPHLLRDQILDAMATHGSPISPIQLQRILAGHSLGSVAYHARVLALAGLVELAHEERVRGAVEHYYALVPDVAEEFVDPVLRLQMLCGERTTMDDASGFPKVVELNEETRRALLDFLESQVKPRVGEILGERRRR